jgi:hypothetical protein
VKSEVKGEVNDHKVHQSSLTASLFPGFTTTAPLGTHATEWPTDSKAAPRNLQRAENNCSHWITGDE